MFYLVTYDVFNKKDICLLLSNMKFSRFTTVSGHRKQYIYYLWWQEKEKRNFRQPPILPGRLQPSTVGRLGLNHRVRDVNGCYP